MYLNIAFPFRLVLLLACIPFYCYAQDIATDEFNNSNLNQRWYILNPNPASEIKVENGLLKMKASIQNGGSDLINFSNYNAPRILQRLNPCKKYLIETKIKGIPTNNYQGVGFVVVRSDSINSTNINRVCQYMYRSEEYIPCISMINIGTEYYGSPTYFDVIPYSNDSIYFRISTDGHFLKRWYSQNGNSWIYIDSIYTDERIKYVGPFTASQYWAPIAAKDFNAQFEYWRITEEDINPIKQQQTFSICSGDTVKIGNNIYTGAGIFTDTLESSNGCDSIVSTNIVIKSCTQDIGGVINKYGAVSSISCNNITVENPQLFSVGDRVLIIQMQGAKTDTSYSASFGTILDYASSGNYEFNTIKTISGNNIILEFALKKTYDLKGSVQLIFVPVYDDVTINQRLTGKQWDGKTGGVIALEASGNITMNADIDASGLGFRGGKVKQNELSLDRCQPSVHYGSFLDNKGGQKGEGIAKWDSLRILNKGAWTNGGGGGNDHNSGGGGGGNGGKGGRGGKLYYEPNDQPNCQGGHGQPGNLLAPTNNKLFLGGGGGAGHDNDLVGSSGAEGGGIVIVKATNIIGNNFEINVNGSSALHAQNDGAGGGGGGGTIAISAQNIINCKLNADGGNGGNNTWTYANQCVGTGGGGGGGIILYNGNLNNSGISVANGIAGKLSHAVIPGPCSNINFEAENGLPGRSQSGLVLAYSDQIIGNSDTVYQEICQGDEYVLPDGTSVTEAGIYSVSISGSGGCDSVIITDLKVVATPKSIQLASEKICPGDTIVLSVNIKADEVITWPDGSSDNSYIVTSPGVYSIVVSNECGSTTSDVNILPDECNTCGIFIPNAFTPNADGINDRFKPIITCEEVEPYLFRIYNRWNELVFETNESELGWDGIYKGQQQPTDSYIYIVSYFNPLLKKEIIKKGVVTKLK